jgi:hypothetical protein
MGDERRPVGSFVYMSDPTAESYFVKDISNLEGGSWRWTHQRPELRFWLTSTKKQKFKMIFAIADATMEQTGPITLSIFVNKNLLDTLHFTHPGEQPFEKPVPSSWLRKDAFTTVAVEVDKPYIAAGDGARLGFILRRAGFVQ